MSIETFSSLANLLPEPMLLVSGEGSILAANRAFYSQLEVNAETLLSRPLFDWVAETKEEVESMLCQCSRSREALPIALTFHHNGSAPRDFRGEGAVLTPRNGAATSVIMLRLQSKQAKNSEFYDLNMRLGEQTRAARYNQQTEELLAHSAAVIESADDAIISKTLQGIITSWNSGAERTFGYTASEAIGKPITMLIPPERLEEETDIIQRLRRGERIRHYHTERFRKDGTRIAVSLTVSPVKNQAGIIVGASKIARDITEQKQREQEREKLLRRESEARSMAEQASLMKDEFLATLSHELRTPLNAILGWSQILAMRPDDSVIAQGLEVIQRNARAQTQLIEDLLDMSRIASGKVRLDVQLVELSSVVEAAVDSVRPTADQKEIQLRKIIDPRAGSVSGDPTRLQQVVWNLLTNAIKFTPKGGCVEVLLQRVNSHIEIVVHDTGVGIRPEFLPVVFERFRQADSSTTRSYGGLGLGLSIVKHLVELHGGSVRAASDGEGKGSTFTVNLPIAPLRHEATREHPKTTRNDALNCEGVDLEGVRILLVDDEIDARTMIGKILTHCGAEVRTAGNADDGVALVQEFGPHLVISDIGMPHKDGYQFIKEVRKLPAEEGGNVPAIALTAFARTEDRTRAIMAGYHIHVAKPVEARELLATVHSVAQRARMHR